MITFQNLISRWYFLETSIFSLTEFLISKNAHLVFDEVLGGLFGLFPVADGYMVARDQNLTLRGFVPGRVTA